MSPRFRLVLCFPVGLLAELSAAEKPNLVLIFADDLGRQECGCTGSDVNQTPHLARLAKQGMVFTQTYAAAGICAPSRACLISGQDGPKGAFSISAAAC